MPGMSSKHTFLVLCSLISPAAVSAACDENPKLSALPTSLLRQRLHFPVLSAEITGRESFLFLWIGSGGRAQLPVVSAKSAGSPSTD
jgi:hypothetical protein